MKRYTQPTNTPSDLTTAPTTAYKQINGQRVAKNNGAFVWLEYAKIKTIAGGEHDISYSLYEELSKAVEKDEMPKFIKMSDGSILSSGQITSIKLHQKRWLMVLDENGKTKLVEP